MEPNGTAALQLHLFDPPARVVPYLVKAPTEFVDEAMADLDPTRQYDHRALPAFIANWLVIDPELGCWLWTRSLTTGGYGQVWVPRSAGDVWTDLAATPPGPKRTHRLAWELLVGPIDRATVLDHQCERPACCNPAHLKPTTISENSIRARQGRYQTHCKRGHQLVAPGRRVGGCRLCSRIILAASQQGLRHPDETGVYDPVAYGLTEDGRSRGRRRST